VLKLVRVLVLRLMVQYQLQYKLVLQVVKVLLVHMVRKGQQALREPLVRVPLALQDKRVLLDIKAQQAYKAQQAWVLLV